MSIFSFFSLSTLAEDEGEAAVHKARCLPGRQEGPREVRVPGPKDEALQRRTSPLASSLAAPAGGPPEAHWVQPASIQSARQVHLIHEASA